MTERCQCPECRAGDALPEHLQGIPGAWQAKLFPDGGRSMEDPARASCRERCAIAGDPPCYDVHRDMIEDGTATGDWKPCADCLDEIGCEAVDPLDENAVVRPLL